MSNHNDHDDDAIEEIFGLMVDSYTNARQIIVRNAQTGEMNARLIILN